MRPLMLSSRCHRPVASSATAVAAVAAVAAYREGRAFACCRFAVAAELAAYLLRTLSFCSWGEAEGVTPAGDLYSESPPEDLGMHCLFLLLILSFHVPPSTRIEAAIQAQQQQYQHQQQQQQQQKQQQQQGPAATSAQEEAPKSHPSVTERLGRITVAAQQRHILQHLLMCRKLPTAAGAAAAAGGEFQGSEQRRTMHRAAAGVSGSAPVGRSLSFIGQYSRTWLLLMRLSYCCCCCCSNIC